MHTTLSQYLYRSTVCKKAPRFYELCTEPLLHNFQIKRPTITRLLFFQFVFEMSIFGTFVINLNSFGIFVISTGSYTNMSDATYTLKPVFSIQHLPYCMHKVVIDPLGWVHHSWRFGHTEVLREMGPEMPERGSNTSTVPVIWATFEIFSFGAIQMISCRDW
jgi:hypothetical protein